METYTITNGWLAMTQKSRRRVLGGLGLALPAAWINPVVETVVLPVHAQTSGCGAPEGCYAFGAQSFSWPGGMGPFEVPLFGSNNDCDGEPTFLVLIVVAANVAEAAEAFQGFDCPGAAFELPPVTPAPPAGCSFFSCNP